MAFVRIDLQVTDKQAEEIAPLLAERLGGFLDAYDTMIAGGTTGPDKHYQMLYRAKEVQQAMDAEDRG